MVKEEDKDMEEGSIAKIISSLKGSFRDHDFTMAEFVLVTREENLKAEIKKLSEEIMVLKKDSGEKDKEILSLRRKNCQLENSKAVAEAELEFLKKKFEALRKRIVFLEEEMIMVYNSEAVVANANGRTVDNRDNVKKTAENVVNGSKKADAGVGNGSKNDTTSKDNGQLKQKESSRVSEAKGKEENVEKTKEKVVNGSKKADVGVGNGPKSDTMKCGRVSVAKDKVENVEKTKEKVFNGSKKADFAVGNGSKSETTSKESARVSEAREKEENVEKTKEKVIKTELQSEESNGAYEAKRNQENVEKPRENVVKAEPVDVPSCFRTEETKKFKAPIDVIEIESDDDDDFVPCRTQNEKESERLGETASDNKLLKRKRESSGENNNSSWKGRMKSPKLENAASPENLGSATVSAPSGFKQGSEDRNHTIPSDFALGDFDFDDDDDDDEDDDDDDDEDDDGEDHIGKVGAFFSSQGMLNRKLDVSGSKV